MTQAEYASDSSRYRRYDYYQTETSVTVSIFAKGLAESDVSVTFGNHSVSKAH